MLLVVVQFVILGNVSILDLSLSGVKGLNPTKSWLFLILFSMTGHSWNFTK